jgi:hypothetical protein
VESVLANIDASYGDCGVEFRRHSVLLVFGAPCQRNLLAGQEHGRTIPLPALRPVVRVFDRGHATQHQGVISFRSFRFSAGRDDNHYATTIRSHTRRRGGVAAARAQEPAIQVIGFLRNVAL